MKLKILEKSDMAKVIAEETRSVAPLALPVIEQLQALCKVQARLTHQQCVEWLEAHGIWAQVPFAVSETEETMWCLFEKHWQEFKEGK